MAQEKGYSYSKRRIDIKKVFGIEGGIVLVLAVTILLLLNYFNILSLSSLYPNFFGFLPHQPISSKTSTSDPNLIGADQITKIQCPVETKYCLQGKKVEEGQEDAKSYWYDWRLPSTSPILAVFDGLVQIKYVRIFDNYYANNLYVISTNGKYRAHYVFVTIEPDIEDKEKSVEIGGVRMGDKIAEIEFPPENESDTNLRFGIEVIHSNKFLDLPLEYIAAEKNLP